MYKINEKIVCVDPVEGLIKGEIYTVKKIHPPLFHEYGVELYEIASQHFTKAFKHTRFRKLDHNFSKNVLEKIIEEILEEELVLVE